VEVWYDGNGEQYFKGGWSQFAKDHDIHQGFFMTFDFHIGTSKFDVKIYDGTQCVGGMTPGRVKRLERYKEYG
jgi:hypothetical protein